MEPPKWVVFLLATVLKFRLKLSKKGILQTPINDQGASLGFMRLAAFPVGIERLRKNRPGSVRAMERTMPW